MSILNLFSRSRAKVNAITFPTFSWEINEENRDVIRWINPEQTVALSVNVFNKEPDIPTIQNLEVLRDYYRNQVVPHKGGLIEVEPVTLKGFEGIKTIFKFPQSTGGMMYLGSFTIPFKKHSYVIKIQANEVGFTGVREAVVTEKVGGDNFTHEDPYDKLFNGEILRNQSEEVQYDDEFPEHPLSIVRKMLDTIENDILFSEELNELKVFDY